MNKFYGSRLCPDCVKAFAYLDSIGYNYLFIDITGSMQSLKEFLHLRDTNADFGVAKEFGQVGIPTIVTNDGNVIIGDDVFSIKK